MEGVVRAFKELCATFPGSRVKVRELSTPSTYMLVCELPKGLFVDSPLGIEVSNADGGRILRIGLGFANLESDVGEYTVSFNAQYPVEAQAKTIEDGRFEVSVRRWSVLKLVVYKPRRELVISFEE